MEPPRLDALSPDECLYLLGGTYVGRVGLSMQALPVVLPVNFSLFDNDIVFRTAAGTKFHAASQGAVLAFEADGYELDGMSGWSVLVQGASRVVNEPMELLQVGALTLEPWALDGAADRYVRIASSRVSGRRFRRNPS
jgi:nitroimidazol reductase NimA-like FMN-containing flavoprotein (pyridoxamine 5'-phosphate oxidase superfamily)